MPTHSFVSARAERHPRGVGTSVFFVVCVIVGRMCTHTHRDVTGFFPPRFTAVHPSQRRDSEMTRLTAPLCVVSDRNISLASIWGP